MSSRESRALKEQRRWLIETASFDNAIDLGSLWGDATPVYIEIGFGSGAATVAMAAAQPSIGILAVDIHTPGVGDLLDRIGEEHLMNVRVMEADALVVLQQQIAQHSLAGVRSFFPDPWPKSRHHKRRLVQQSVLDLVWSRVVPGGTWHIATDWAQYAESMIEVFANDARWSGGVVERPADRPITPFERRALRDGRPITDLVYRALGATTGG